MLSSSSATTLSTPSFPLSARSLVPASVIVSLDDGPWSTERLVSSFRRQELTPVCSGWLFITAALQGEVDKQTKANTFDPAVGKAALSTYFLFSFTFMFSYTPLQTVVPVESLETTLRAKGLGLGSVISGMMGFLNQFCGPIALKNIGYGYVYFFAAWDIIEAIGWYFLGVEGQGRTLEELAWVYDQPNPVKASQKVVRSREDVSEEEL